MEFEEDFGEGNQIKAVSSTSININDESYTQSLIVTADQVEVIQELNELSEIYTVFPKLKLLTPEIIIIGTGKDHLFPEPTFYQFFIENNMGVEFMSTSAACRTYNLLIAEGRSVAAVLLLP